MTRTAEIIDRTAFRLCMTRAGFPNYASLGRAVGLRKSAIHSVFWGQNPKPELQQRIAAALGVRADQLWRPVTFTSVIF